MQKLADLLSLETIQRLSLPSNFRYGEAIFRRGAVEFIKHSQTEAEAWIGGLDGTVVEGSGSRRHTTFAISEGKLIWHCTGNPKNHDIFCKHCVALALALLDIKH